MTILLTHLPQVDAAQRASVVGYGPTGRPVARLRRAVSDLTLDKLILKEAATGDYVDRVIAG